MCITTLRKHGNDRPEAILPSIITFANLQSIFSKESPENRVRKYAYDIIEKAYWINEKKIEMLDFEKSNRLLRQYVENFKCKRR